MKKIRHIIGLAAVLFAALSAGSCQDPSRAYDDAQLLISVYIPETVPTKADPTVTALQNKERTIYSLQVWVFLHHPGYADDGFLICYGNFDQHLSETGLPNSAITRFGVPLTGPQYTRLRESGTKVDVYAVANMPSGSAVRILDQGNVATATLNEDITRAELEKVVLTGDSFGAETLVTSFPDATGLPMAGVLEDAPVSGDYPVLNISSLSLTRAVSKIRFVFCQQANPPTYANPELTPFNNQCKIISIRFDGGEACGIADKEYLFTTQTHPNTDDLFHVSGYTPLAKTLSGSSGQPLVPNKNLALAEFPELYAFRSMEYPEESIKQYETRLDTSIALSSQVGPIYLRETDKRISGTIVYNTGGENQTATFSLGDGEYLTRNHSWTVYAYFAEETKLLLLTVAVNKWDWTEYPIDFKTNSVNVVRRFTVLEQPPVLFHKESSGKSGIYEFYDVRFWHTVVLESEDPEVSPTTVTNNAVEGDIIISTPVGATLFAEVIPGVLEGYEFFAPEEGKGPLFEVTPISKTIYPNYQNPETGRIEDCIISFKIRCNEKYTGETYKNKIKGQYIDLHFYVRQGDRYIDIGSESVDSYRFILDPDWNAQQNGNG